MKLAMSSVPVKRAHATAWKPTFDLDAPGFERQWWDRTLRGEACRRAEFYRWTLHGEEVARAHIDLDREVEGEYLTIGELPELTHDVSFFEVHNRLRLQGIGREAVRQLEAKFPDRILTAFSEEADGFWARSRWLRCPRADGNQRLPPLFVRLPARLALE